MHKLAEVEESYDGESPNGSWRDGYTTYVEPSDSPLADGVVDFLARKAAPGDVKNWQFDRYQGDIRRSVRDKPLTFTVHNCWSGYSEYTITDVWSEISFTWGEHEHHFEGMAEFFRALGDSVPARDRL